MEVLLTHKQYLLKKFPGKGGWTYAEIPEIPVDKQNPFGWVRVKGRVDSHYFDRYHLMPMKNGSLFLPVKAAIRKKINKQAGDFIEVELYRDDSALAVPPELEECLLAEPVAHSFFHSLKEGEQKQLVDWIYAARKDETKAERIVSCIELLLKKKILRHKNET